MPTEPARRWKILAKAVRQMVAFAEYLLRHAIQVQFLMGHFRGLENRVRSLIPTLPPTSSTTPTAPSTGTTGTTRRSTTYPKEPATCIHKSCATNPDPIHNYKNRGRNYRACRLYGARWLDSKG